MPHLRVVLTIVQVLFGCAYGFFHIPQRIVKSRVISWRLFILEAQCCVPWMGVVIDLYEMLKI